MRLVLALVDLGLAGVLGTASFAILDLAVFLEAASFTFFDLTGVLEAAVFAFLDLAGVLEAKYFTVLRSHCTYHDSLQHLAGSLPPRHGFQGRILPARHQRLLS